MAQRRFSRAFVLGLLLVVCARQAATSPSAKRTAEAGAASFLQKNDVYECLDGPDRFANTLNVGVASGQSKYKSFDVPPMSKDSKDYRYAFENAFILLPTRCALDLGLTPNIGDANGIIAQWMGRMGDMLAAPAMLHGNIDPQKVLGDCACGWVIFLHGSGGFTYDNMRYATMLATDGYGVFVPDSFASNLTGFRYKAPSQSLPKSLAMKNTCRKTQAYWCENNVYEPDSECPGAMVNQSTSKGYPLCYDSNAGAIVSHAKAWREFYERVFRLRQLEMDYVVEHLPEYIRSAPKLFLAGESEGGMAAARYYHPELEPLLAAGGRIILQWSCEFNYFLSCPENARIGAGKANKSTPILNMISDQDPFFAAHGSSIATSVSRAEGGYGKTNLTGNCFAQVEDQGLENAVVFDLLNTEYHGLTVNTGNFVRAALKGFVASPQRYAEQAAENFGPQGNGLCTVVRQSNSGKRFYGYCRELGNEQDVNASEVSACAYPKYKLHKQYYSYGVNEFCSRPIKPMAAVVV